MVPVKPLKNVHPSAKRRPGVWARNSAASGGHSGIVVVDPQSRKAIFYLDG